MATQEPERQLSGVSAMSDVTTQPSSDATAQILPVVQDGVSQLPGQVPGQGPCQGPYQDYLERCDSTTCQSIPIPPTQKYRPFRWQALDGTQQDPVEEPQQRPPQSPTQDLARDRAQGLEESGRKRARSGIAIVPDSPPHVRRRPELFGRPFPEPTVVRSLSGELRAEGIVGPEVTELDLRGVIMAELAKIYEGTSCHGLGRDHDEAMRCTPEHYDATLRGDTLTATVAYKCNSAEAWAECLLQIGEKLEDTLVKLSYLLRGMRAVASRSLL
jgi:hypothetical protein